MKTQGNQREAALAYLAGIVDGEGYLGLTKASHRVNGKGSGQIYMPMIKIAMTDREAVDLFFSVFGYGWYGYRQPYKDDKYAYRLQFVWQASGRKKVLAVLQALLPHLRIKKLIAEMMIEYCNGYKFMRNNPEEERRREDFYIRIKKLQKRAPATTKPADPERGCDSLNPGESQGEESEAVPPPIIH